MTLFATGCAGLAGDRPEPASGEQFRRGGVWRVLAVDFGFTNGFDPTGENYSTAFGIYTNLLLRTLVSPRHVAGPEGNEVVEDLATHIPKPTEEGTKFTFTLRPDVRFAPPVDRPITSRDIEYAFERIATPSLVAQYGFYYTDVIAGMREFADGKANDISGIDTPDDQTIVFELVHPVGDFVQRLSMPATAPIPREVARCFPFAGEYGRYVISSGPYMIEGSDSLDISTCKSIRPLSGFEPTRHLFLVRNPTYDPATDSPEMRRNFVDRVELTINTSVDDIFKKIELGEAEDTTEIATPSAIRRFSTRDELRGRMVVSNADIIQYISLNLTVPPFDDVYVRRAVNLAVDKESLRRAAGGEAHGEIATHVVPPGMTGGRPTADEYDPYDTGFSGDADAARAAMRESPYDSNGDGRCDATVCEDVLMLAINRSPNTEMIPVLVENLSEIGIELVPRELEVGAAFGAMGTVADEIPLEIFSGWAGAYGDPSTIMVLFDGRNITPRGNVNHALVGLSPKRAADVGVKGGVDHIPSEDREIDRCSVLAGSGRSDCWRALDRTLMEDVVPWVPWLWANQVAILGPAVTNYEFDRMSTTTAYAHVAVDPEAQTGR